MAIAAAPAPAPAPALCSLHSPRLQPEVVEYSELSKEMAEATDANGTLP